MITRKLATHQVARFAGYQGTVPVFSTRALGDPYVDRLPVAQNGKDAYEKLAERPTEPAKVFSFLAALYSLRREARSRVEQTTAAQYEAMTKAAGVWERIKSAFTSTNAALASWRQAKLAQYDKDVDPILAVVDTFADGVLNDQEVRTPALATWGSWRTVAIQGLDQFKAWAGTDLPSLVQSADNAKRLLGLVQFQAIPGKQPPRQKSLLEILNQIMNPGEWPWWAWGLIGTVALSYVSNIAGVVGRMLPERSSSSRPAPPKLAAYNPKFRKPRRPARR